MSNNRDILAIGTSAGGVEALLFLARHLPSPFAACVLVTIHLPSGHRSSMDELMSRAGPLPASFARHGEPLRKGRILLAPPGFHLLVDKDRVVLGTGPRENNVRPSIDAMLRSVALCCGSRAVGAVLTGTQGDGASGLWAVNRCGGLTVVQDPQDARFSEMPQSALNLVQPDHVVSLREIPALLASLVEQPAAEPIPAPQGFRYEVDIARGRETSMEETDGIGQRSVLACPECHGVMWEIDEGELTRYRCHVGHTYNGDTMSLALDDNLRRALASAQRALEERVALARKLQQRAEQAGHRLTAASWAQKAGEFEQEMVVIRDAMQRMDDVARPEQQVAAG